jgi:hypothetical protein
MQNVKCKMQNEKAVAMAIGNGLGAFGMRRPLLVTLQFSFCIFHFSLRPLSALQFLNPEP